MLKIKTTNDKLLGPLAQVTGIVERRHTLPILSNVLISASGSRVEFLATDLEVQITSKAELAASAVVRIAVARVGPRVGRGDPAAQDRDRADQAPGRWRRAGITRDRIEPGALFLRRYRHRLEDRRGQVPGLPEGDPDGASQPGDAGPRRAHAIAQPCRDPLERKDPRRTPRLHQGFARHH